MTPINPSRPDPATATPSDYPLMPGWVDDFRPAQRECVERIIEMYESGTDVVILEAPTGTGKTLIAEMIRASFTDARSLYVATTKSLQDQFLRDFPHAKVLKGRSNYPTLDDPKRFLDKFAPLSAADCQRTFERLPACGGCKIETEEKVRHCLNCHPFDLCPYQIALKHALDATTAVVNTSYLLAEANGPGRFGFDEKHETTTFPLIVADECDTLEGVLMGEVTIEVSPQRQRKWRLDKPKKVTVKESWEEWAHDTAETMSGIVENLELQAEQARSSGGVNPKLQRDLRSASGLLDNLQRLKLSLHPDADPAVHPQWAYDSREHRNDWVKFRPVTTGQYGPDLLWRHAPKWLAMSASVISADEFAESTGLNAATRPDGRPLVWDSLSIQSDFPVANRPIFVVPGPKVTAKTADETEPIMAKLVTEVGRLHPDERILVHTVSYRMTQRIADVMRAEPDLRRRVITYTNTDTKEQALTEYLDTPGAIMLAPSLDRGTDLPGDACRVQVIAKVPYLFLDAQTQARLYGTGMSGQLWYDVATIRTIVQMTGRAVRSANDQATTYILDGSFLSLWSKRRMLFPKWWKDGLRFDGIDELQKILASTS